MRDITAAVITFGQLLCLQTMAAAPSLEIQQLPSRSIQLKWPGDATGFTLEQTDQLDPQPNWRTVGEAPQNIGGSFSFNLQPVAETRFFRLRSGANQTTRVVDTSPADGESSVAVTRETIFHLSGPVAPGIVVTSADFFAQLGSRRLLTRVELSSDRRTLTLFYLENLPASARIVVTLDGTALGIDADGDGQEGGVSEMRFDTLGITGLTGTAVIGHVYASEKSGGTNVPLANVTVTVDGAEEKLRTTTDASGFFRLTPAPAGTFFVHVDGRTATGSHWPGGAYYPFVGKAWEAVAGRTNNLAGGSGEIFLPLIQSDALQAVSAAAETKITFPPSVLATNPALSGVEVMVPANSLFSDNGTRGGKVGIAPVPANRLPEPLPPGLSFPLVITIQTDGASNFDVPVPVKFPNLPDPITGVKLPPGAKTALWSFNHDTGRWEIQGSMTISADGLFAVSDAGAGVRQPGWHGAAPGSSGSGPRNNGGGDPPKKRDPEPECDDPCKILGQNYVACWDGYYERYLKGAPPDDPAERKKWEQDKAEKLGECDDKLKDLMECRGSAGGPCGGPGGGFPLRRQGARNSALAFEPQAVFARAATLDEMQQNYEDAGITWPGAGAWFRIASMETGFEQRGRLSAEGRFENIILAPNEYYMVGYYNPVGRQLGAAIFRSAGNGVTTFIPRAILHPDDQLDTDGDGLSDITEQIIGTSESQVDSDGDGFSDGAELSVDSNPLDGQGATLGAVTTVPTPGPARTLAVAGDLALVGSAGGVSWFDVQRPENPLLLGSLTWPGTQRPSVALTYRWGVYFLATASSLTILDFSSPNSSVPAREIQLAVNPHSLAAFGDFAYVSDVGTLYLIDLKKGVVLDSHHYEGGVIDDIAFADGYIYMICSSSLLTQTVHKLALGETLGEPLSSYVIDVGFATGYPLDIAVAEKLIFVAPIDKDRVPGITILRDTGSAIVLSASSTPNNALKNTPAGSGKLLFSGAQLNILSEKLLNLLDVSDPTRTDRFVTGLKTPGGDAEAIAVHRGFALVADVAAGLSVMRFQTTTAETNPPTITLRTPAGAANPLSTENDSLFLVLTDAADNQLVREVEFFVDGESAAVDGGVPFEAHLVAPPFTSGKTQIEVQARATDLAGNATWSNPLTVKITKETVAPFVAERTPGPGTQLLAGQLNRLAVRFSEPLLRASVGAGSLRLFSAGADAQLGTPDDVAVPGQFAFASDDTSLLLNLSTLLPAGAYRVALAGTVTDLRSNPLGSDITWNFDVQAPILWNASAPGNWSESSKWSPVRLPGPNDFAIIDRPDGIFPVTFDIYDRLTDLQSLFSAEPFIFGGLAGQNVSLRAQQGAKFLGPVTFASTTFLHGGPWQFGGGITIPPQRIVELGNDPSFGSPGPIIIGAPGAASLIDDALLRPVGGAVLNHPLGSTLELRSTGNGIGYGFIDAANQFTGPSTRFVNEGLVTKTGPGVFSIAVPFFRNLGVLDVQTGKLSIQSPFGQAGEIAQDGVLRIAAGATAELTQLLNSSFSMGRLARVEGNGTMIFAAPTTVNSPYEFAGETRVEQSVKFNNRVRTSGSFFTRLASEFAGLTVELTGPVEFNGGQIRFNQTIQTVLPAVNITRQTTLGGRTGAIFGQPLSLEAASIVVDCPIRFDAPVQIKNDITSLNASGYVEFASASPSTWDQGNINLTGGRSRILSGAVFEAQSSGIFSARGFRNEGTFRKTGNTTTIVSLIRPAAGEFSFVNAGLFEVTGGLLETSTEPGTFQNAGTARFSGGQFVLRNEYNQVSGETVLAGGILATRTVVRIAGGEIRGAGVLPCATLTLANDATLNPGSPLGVIAITNKLSDQTFGDGGLGLANNTRVIIDLGGRNPGVDYDQVILSGPAALRGILEVRLVNGFVPKLGDEFTIIMAKSHATSTFTNAVLPSPGTGRKFEVIYDATTVKLRVVPG